MPDRRTILTTVIGLVLLLSGTLSGVLPPLTTTTFAAPGPAYDLGAPTAEGTTLRVPLTSPAEQAMLTFSVRGPGPSRIELFVGDQWYDVDAALYRRVQGANLLGDQPIVVLDRSDRRRIQFVSPEDALLPSMPAGDYVLVVGHKYALTPELATDFVPDRDVAVRVAVGGPICTLTPPDDPATGTRPDSSLYQLGLVVEPSPPGRTSLLTFTAVTSPPFTDLFDYAWSVDGVPVDGVTGAVYQRSARELGATSGGQHTVTVTARGAREYRDPTEPRFSHLPLDGGTAATTCAFELGA